MKKEERNQMVTVLSEYFKSIHQHFHQSLDKKKLYPGQPQLLALIMKNEGITQKELADKKSVKPATITGMLSKLELNHYVIRVPDAADKRIMRVFLTPEGKKLAIQGECFLEDMIEKAFEGFTKEDLQTFVKLTNKMKDNLLKNTSSTEQ